MGPPTAGISGIAHVKFSVISMERSVPYSVLFEDPDGIRIKANFVPGKRHFA